ncbi:MAG: PEP/pyruvate-binding domain-containing protein [Patescibacteria group bacterium]|jgi:pyruvate,water dikinase
MFIKKFKEISKHDADIAGGKGASLGEMTKAKIAVPPGFVILAPSFDKFLEETMLFEDIQSILNKVNHKDINSVDRASHEIRDMILKADFPKDIGKEIMAEFKTLGAEYVAVRSSATAEDSSSASWAGELESYLNTNKSNLLYNVKQCWSSLFTPRAIFYRFEKKMHKQKVSVAVVVQKMVQSEISGIAFTVHPVTKDPNQMIIEAGFGLGEAIVSGSITPDNYVLDKRDFSIIDINIAEQDKMITRFKNSNKWVNVKFADREKQKINGRQIVVLAKMCDKIEKHYGFPCDIEWAFEGGKFYITQSRPITTL